MSSTGQQQSGSESNPIKADIMAHLGCQYELGEDVEQDDAKALKYFTKAAEKGSVFGMYGVGALHYEGKGVAQNHSEAFKWLKEAADRGEPAAMHNLAVM